MWIFPSGGNHLEFLGVFLSFWEIQIPIPLGFLLGRAGKEMPKVFSFEVGNSPKCLPMQPSPVIVVVKNPCEATGKWNWKRENPGVEKQGKKKSQNDQV